MMGLDWKIIVGQIINFIIFVYLLNRFGFKPLFALLEKRRKEIEEGVNKSKELDKKLEELKKEKQLILKQAKEEAEKFLKLAEKKAEEKRKELLKEAEEERKRIIKEAQQKAIIEIALLKKKFLSEANEIMEKAVKKVLKKEIDVKEDEKIIKDFLLNYEENSKVS